MELISVIVPVYKVEKYLKKCVDSILAQTYSNLEIILVNDGSPDSCSQICDDYLGKDSRIRVIHQENGGLSVARNTGIANARGRYLGFVDSDDYIDEKMYELLYNAITESEADIAVCSYNRVDEKGNLIPAISPIQNEVYTSDEMLEKLQKRHWGYYITAWNKLYKREIFDDIQFPNGKIYEDMYIMHRIYYKCDKIVTIKDALYNYVKREGSIVASKKTPKHLDDIEARIHKFYFYKEKGYTGLYEDFFEEFIVAYERRRAPIRVSGLADIKRIVFIDKKVRKVLFENYGNLKWTGYVKYMIPGVWIITHKLFGKVFNKVELLLALIHYRIKLMGASFILLDTPMHGNIGDQAIALAETQLLKKLFPKKRYVELTGREINFKEKYLAKLTPKSKVVLVHGGGFLGILWPSEEERFRRILRAFSKHRVIVLPQTATFDLSTEEGIGYLEQSKRIYESHPNLTVFLREQKSFQFMQKYFPNVDSKVVPDIVLLLRGIKYLEPAERCNVLCCLRNDHEKKLDTEQLDELLDKIKNITNENIVYTDTVLRDRNIVSKAERETIVLKKLSEFANAKLVVTDRLHGMVFAALVGTPCIAIGNTNGKVRGVYAWLQELPYLFYLDEMNDINHILSELKLESAYKYSYELSAEKFTPLISCLKIELN